MRFNWPAALVVALMGLVLSGCVATTSKQPFVVNARVSNVLEPNAEVGIVTYSTIQAAINAAPAEAKNWTIVIGEGRYHERVLIDKPGIRLIGAGKNNTRITFDRYAGQPVSAYNEETWGTFRTAVVEVLATDVSLFDLTIENTFDYPGVDRLPKGHPDKVKGTQAVALKIAEQADRTLLQRVALLGYQDTLYVQGGRTYVTDSEIRGHVDFIFGDGNALFEYVDVISRPRAQPMTFTGYLTAPSTLLDNAYGFTFVNSRMLREPGVPDNSVPLGRPWHPTTTFDDGRYANPYAVGKATFINTFMDAHIADVGWGSMSGTAKDGSRKRFDPLDDARFSEWGSYGPGAVVNTQRPQLRAQEVANYSAERVLEGWQPQLLPRPVHKTMQN
ncbi:pectinesterase family protein [Alteromonas gilva]|uniref:Pectinesterase family protein n=1 Tax=Alteromonas gilva TaxID=2987522 RepID=A0ABT5KZ15_9ALTE|nr:pectinesterase family protein [Alteromonas gilva]MDC8829446.1 pectinesterase family protein [Alteromonas gilva]